jgi:hypothetical protein
MLGVAATPEAAGVAEGPCPRAFCALAYWPVASGRISISARANAAARDGAHLPDAAFERSTLYEFSFLLMETTCYCAAGTG